MRYRVSSIEYAVSSIEYRVLAPKDSEASLLKTSTTTVVTILLYIPRNRLRLFDEKTLPGMS